MTPTRNRQLTTTAEKATTLREFLITRKGELQAALPRHISADRMLRLVLTAVARNPKLLECTIASIYGSVLQSAQLGLEIDLQGQAWLVPFRNTRKNVTECQFIPGYLGLVALARRSGQIASVEARVVRKGDRFEFAYGLAPKLEHVPDPSAKGELTHAYAIARFLHKGDPSWECMSRGEIEKHRKRSRAANEGPWVTDYDAMCKKTVLRVLCKLLPSSVELQRAVALDEAADAGLPQELPGELTTVVAATEPAEPLEPPAEPQAPTAAGEGSETPPAAKAPDDCGCPDAPNNVHVPECKRGGQPTLPGVS